MDDDFAALKWNALLLTRDLRTIVCQEAQSPKQLISGPINWDVLLIDAEYFPEEPPLETLINMLRHDCPDAAIICLSQYGEIDRIRAAIRGGAKGFLLKNEVRMGIASAVVQALCVDFVTTPGVHMVLNSDFRTSKMMIKTIPLWQPTPYLTPQISQVFTLRVLYGMSASGTAQKLSLACGTVEKYIQYAYQRISMDWGDVSYLAGLKLQDTPAEVQAFHLFNLPPKVI